MTDWEKELARIDKKLAALSDDKLIAAADAEAGGAELPASVRPAQAGTVVTPVTRAVPRSRLGLFARVSLALLLGVAIIFWPYEEDCGAGLFAYLGALTVVGASGVIAAVASWRRRAPVSHVASLVVVLWTIALMAVQVLPRVGYAAVASERPATWLCR